MYQGDLFTYLKCYSNLPGANEVTLAANFTRQSTVLNIYSRLIHRLLKHPCLPLQLCKGACLIIFIYLQPNINSENMMSTPIHPRLHQLKNKRLSLDQQDPNIVVIQPIPPSPRVPEPMDISVSMIQEPDDQDQDRTLTEEPQVPQQATPLKTGHDLRILLNHKKKVRSKLQRNLKVVSKKTPSKPRGTPRWKRVLPRWSSLQLDPTEWYDTRPADENEQEAKKLYRPSHKRLQFATKNFLWRSFYLRWNPYGELCSIPWLEYETSSSKDNARSGSNRNHDCPVLVNVKYGPRSKFYELPADFTLLDGLTRHDQLMPNWLKRKGGKLQFISRVGRQYYRIPSHIRMSVLQSMFNPEHALEITYIILRKRINKIYFNKRIHWPKEGTLDTVLFICESHMFHCLNHWWNKPMTPQSIIREELS